MAVLSTETSSFMAAAAGGSSLRWYYLLIARSVGTTAVSARTHGNHSGAGLPLCRRVLAHSFAGADSGSTERDALLAEPAAREPAGRWVGPFRAMPLPLHHSSCRDAAPGPIK